MITDMIHSRYQDRSLWSDRCAPWPSYQILLK